MNTYHDQLDQFEARVRAEADEIELYCERCDNTGFKRISPTILATCDHEARKQPVFCICLEVIGDNGFCPVHGFPVDYVEEGSDNTMSTQLDDAGFGSGGVQ